MKQKVLIIGASGGIGSSLSRLMSTHDYDVAGWSSQDLDLNYPGRIFDCDFSHFDILVNCAGHNRGTWRGNLQNTWENQLSMIIVNYASNFFLMKHYAKSRDSGTYVWISSDSIDQPTTYQGVYAGTKMASKFSLDLLAREADHITVLSAKVGLTKTNFRYRNFEGTKSWQEVEETYGDRKIMSADSVAQRLFQGIKSNTKEMVIT